MKLSELLDPVPNARVTGDSAVDVTGVTSDSRAVKPGFVFVAMPGATPKSRHGMEFVQTALKAGAVAVVTDGNTPAPAGVTTVIVPKVPAALSFLSEAMHGFPSWKMRLLGVTGTNGKTTSTHLLEAMAQANGEKAGFIGTTAIRVDRQEQKTAHTTPPADLLSEVLGTMVGRGVTTCAMEVSSHALDQQRVEGLRYRGAIFTNLTQDHLDYHQTIESYFNAKLRLFSELIPKDGVGVLNADDPMVATVAARARCKTLSFSATGQPSDVRAAQTRRSTAGTEIDVDGAFGKFTLKTPLVGTYNVANILGAAALHLATGTALAAVVAGAGALARVPGRLDAVIHPRGAHVLVDYAHTDDALARALDAVKPYVAAKGRLFVVFGCGGDRDAGKRPRMGEAAALRADVVVVTADNPRSEKPETIAEAIVAGIQKTGMQKTASVDGRGFLVELDRKVAIGLAVRAARRGDVVLLAGKGHETEQQFADRKIPFDDRLVAQEAMAGMDDA